VVRDCQIRDSQVGVYVYEQGQGTIEKCVISGNAKSGVEIKTGGNPTVRNCQINGNKLGGIFVHTQGSGTFMGCTITGVEPWDIQRTAGKVTRTGNTPNA
jgi:parallel beta-helix repeat protein